MVLRVAAVAVPIVREKLPLLQRRRDRPAL